MTPEEAAKALDAGLADKLMIDWYGDDDGRMFVLCPAASGYEGDRAPTWDEMTGGDSFAHFFRRISKGQCVLLQDGRCSIHDSGFKPEQCRTVWHGEKRSCSNEQFNLDTAKKWNTDQGREVLVRWKSTVGFNDTQLQGL